ncbi:hypothetical protein [Acidaminobacter hydrogenoformans]|uniref:Uncharacterized protein n=1 Tax=Acidaminobacter hydrogenoformans DSM 2784 TaxID=1120920 RepID=A0A1G5S6U6_9FIRM|nr:hypothetical protein [Acidaminobacter hydrogenoformans]SCZ82092.1 hypothetical protein SAMN03080599_03349 [Acidaminobacter hydrogenoformans DSM 2784]
MAVYKQLDRDREARLRKIARLQSMVDELRNEDAVKGEAFIHAVRKLEKKNGGLHRAIKRDSEDDEFMKREMKAFLAQRGYK